MKHFLDLGLRLASLVYLVFQFLVVGLALLPAVLFVTIFWTSGSPLLLAFAFGIGYLVFGLTYLALVVLIRHLIFSRSREGDYPFVSSYTIRLSLLPKGKTLPAGAVWGGNPLREIHREGT